MVYINTMVKNNTMDSWEGRINYHTYTENNWLAIDNIDHPLFKILVKRIKEKLSVDNNYQIYIVGGLLEDWLSWDLDFVVCGEYNQVEIYKILDDIVRIGFDMNIFCDVHYIKENKPWDINDWDGINFEQREVYHLSDNFIKDGITSEIDSNYIRDGILFSQTWILPLEKMVNKTNEGYIYHSPLRII